MVERAQRVLVRINWALRLRRAILTLSGSLFGLALAVRALRFFGLSPSPGLLGVSLGFAFLALFFPLRFQRRLFWAGRRLGLGGKLAGLAAALAQKNQAFLSALSENLAFPIRRLFLPEIFALVPAVFLSLFLLLPFSPPWGLRSDFGALPETESGGLTVPQAPAGKEEKKLREPEIPKLPPGFSGSSLYPLVLAALYGEELSLEEAVRRLAEDEGILRRIAEVLGQAAGEPTSEISATLAELVSSLSRPDLKEALSQALDPQNGDTSQAQALVGAALAGISQAREQGLAQNIEPDQAAQNGEASSTFSQDFRQPGQEILLDDEAQEAQLRRELAEAQEGRGLGAGFEPGEPVRPGLPEEREISGEAVAVSVRPHEGLLRVGVALGVPGETPETPAETALALSPTQLELTLRESPLPPALRELVRRYFELISGGQG